MTKLQKKTLDFIASYQANMGHTPSFDEIRIYLGLKSKSGVHRTVHCLEGLGLLRMHPYRARSIELLKPNCDADLVGAFLDMKAEIMQITVATAAEPSYRAFKVGEALQRFETLIAVNNIRTQAA